MALFSPEYVAESQDRHRLIYWKLYDRSKRAEMDSQEKEITLEASKNYLQNSLAALSGDVACVVFYTAAPAKATKGEKLPKTYEVLVKLNAPGLEPRTGISGISINDYIGMHEKISELKMEMLKKELESREKEPSAVDKFLNGIIESGQLNNILLAFMPGPKKQTETAPIEGPDPLSHALKKFAAVDPTYVDTLVKMAAYLEKNPAVLPQIKSIIGA